MLKPKINLSGVNETMLVPVYARAVESQKPHPAFYDKAAIKIINSFDYDFAQHRNKMNLWGCAARTIILDREVKQHIAKHPNCTVINMACGLDDRFHRVDNGKIQWYNIDLPKIMNIRENVFSPHNRVTGISGSITDTLWIEKIKNKDDVLIVAEGILMYLKENEVKDLFKTVSQSFTHCSVICELMSNWMVKNQEKHDTIQRTKAVFSWGVNSSQDFVKLCPNYKMLGDYNLTNTMKKFSPIFISLISPLLYPRNNRIACFEKIN